MLGRFAKVVGAAIALVALLAGVASARTIGPTKIAPHQIFAGLVNDKFTDAVIKVVCPGPANVGRALPGQTVEVMVPLVILQNFGNTGSKGTSITAFLATGATASRIARFGRYGVKKPIPTDIPLPCGGTGIMVFAPQPGSKTAKAATVDVSFANVATAS